MKFNLSSLHIFTVIISSVNAMLFLVSVIWVNINPNKMALTPYDVVSPFYYLGYILVFVGLDLTVVYLIRRFVNHEV